MRINLALQGGGAHGAFSWGVLDRLLQEPEIEIAGISGTSAGAMNAAAVKCGWVESEAEGARAALTRYWEAVSHYTPPVADMQEDFYSLAGPFAGIWKENLNLMGVKTSVDSLDGIWSPYAHNPFDINPVRNIVEREFSNEALRARKGPKVFVNATNVRSGKIKIFSGKTLSTEALLASAALPSVFKAVNIDGEDYWDGGFTGNPALFPLIDETDCEDIVIVHINPIYRDELPTTAADIENRVNEISFNTPLLRELRQIDFIERRLKASELANTKFKRLNIHSIADDEIMNALSADTKVLASASLIRKLFDHGQASADAFLSANGKDVGKRSSCDIRAMFS